MHKRNGEDDYVQNLMDWQEHQYIPQYFINNWRMREWGTIVFSTLFCGLLVAAGIGMLPSRKGRQWGRRGPQ